MAISITGIRPNGRASAQARAARVDLGRATAWAANGVLAVMAIGIPLFSWAGFGDQVVMPRLAGTWLLTGVLLLAVAAGALWRQVDARLAALPLLCACAFLAVEAAATAHGVDPRGALLGEYQRYQGLLPIAVYVALMLGCMCAVAAAGSAEPLAASVSLGGALAGGYAVLQRLGLDWVGWAGIPEGRIGGAFAQPDVLGTYLVMALAVSAGLLATWHGWRRSAVAANVGVMLAALVFTGSRGAWIGAAVSAALIGLALLRRRDLRPLAGAAAAAIALAGLSAVLVPSTRAILGHSLDRAASSADRRDAAVSARLGLWRISLDMIGERPLLGAGPDAFSDLFASHRTAGQPGIGTDNVRPESSHNFALDQLVGAGALGLAAYAALMASGAAIALRHARTSGRRTAALPLAMVAALGGYHAAVFFSFSEAMTGWLPWLLLGGVIGACAPSPGHARGGARRAPVAACAIGLAMIIAAGGLAWADRLDGEARRLADAGLPREAAARASLAARINPLAPRYLSDAAAWHEAAGGADRGEMRAALDAYEALSGRFYRTSYAVLGEARVRASLDPGDPAIARLTALARALDPHNRAVAEEAARIEEITRQHARQPG